MTSRLTKCSILTAALLLFLGFAGFAYAEITQKGDLLVAFEGKITPKALPRTGAAPVAISLSVNMSTTDGTPPPQLQRILIAINRNGHLSTAGLPTCRLNQIQPSTTRAALAACRSALIGEGTFTANVKLPQQSPFPSVGHVLAFNGKVGGKPVFFAHVYGTEPIPTSYTLPFTLGHARGRFGTVLTANLPQTTADWGFITGIQLKLKRRFSYRGTSQSYLSAGCPAPKGFSVVPFPLARASYVFAGHETLTSTLTRTCRARG